MESTADLLTQALFEIPDIKDKVCRMYSKFKNEILNYNFDYFGLPEWSVYQKILKRQYEQEQDLENAVQDFIPYKRKIALSVKSEIESYF